MNVHTYGSVLERTMVEVASLTDAGNVRTVNEDSIAVVHPDEPAKRGRGTILVLADGLGGYNAGEVASNIVATRLPELYLAGSAKEYVSDVVNAVNYCNTIVHEASVSGELQGMGTTLVAAVLVENFVVFVNVGDSRGYLFRDGLVFHRTRDHSLNDAGTDVPGVGLRNRFSHVLTRAIGPEPTVPVDVTAHRIAERDVILLCSDGLTDYVGDDELKRTVLNHSPADAARILVCKAKEQGGEDNISVVVARVHGVPAFSCKEDAST